MSGLARRPTLTLGAVGLLLGACLADAPALVTPPRVTVVFRTPITAHQFNHWMAVATRSNFPGRRRGTIPPLGSKRWKRVRDEVMQFLITARWLEGEARLRKVVVSRASVLREFRRTRAQSFPRPQDFRRFLVRSGMTLPDILYRIKLDALSNAIR